MSDDRRDRARRWMAAVLKLLVVALVVWFIRRTLVDAWRQLGERPWRCDYAWLAASGGLYLLGTLPMGVFWHRTLRAMGQDVGLLQALRAYYVGHLGKYVPGKAMVVVLRTGLVRGRGVDTSLAAASVFFETLTMMSVGAVIAAGILAVSFREQTFLCAAAVGLAVAAGLPTLPPVFRRLARLVGVGRGSPAVAAKLADLGYGTMALGWVLSAVGWAILGMSFEATLRALGEAPGHWLGQLPLDTAAVALATVAGFVSLVPGGAVVREAVLVRFMVPYLGDTAAVLGAVVLRVAWLVAELAISGILYLCFPSSCPSSTKPRA